MYSTHVHVHLRHFVSIPLLVGALLHGQVSGATVSGTVVCDDTGRPAHLAKVYLSSAEPSHAGEKMMHDIQAAIQKSMAKSDTPRAPLTEQQRKRQQQAAKQFDAVAEMLSATNAGLDGTYRISGVKPGTYFVHAQVPGYVDPYSEFSPEDFTSTDPAVRARLAALPTVRIAGEEESPSVTLRLQRGGALTGRVLFDDGTPAAGWAVWALHTGELGEADLALSPSLQSTSAKELGKPVTTTDDRGIYRIAGLPDGQYVLRADVGVLPRGLSGSNAMLAGSGVRIAVYSGNVLLASAAKPVAVHQGEERTEADLVVPAKALRTLSGRVVAVSDGHPLNMGDVMLSSGQDSHLQAKAPIRPDGTFVFEDLPENVTYTLTLDDAADATYAPERESVMGINVALGKATQKYAHATQNVLLGANDTAGVLFQMRPVADAAAK